MRAATQRPHGQIESEGRPRPKRELELWHCRRRAIRYSISLSGMVFGAAAVDFVLVVLEAVVVDFLLCVLDAVAADEFFLCSYL
jgi:hypothetical protein